MTTHDGRTIRYPDPNIKVNDTIRYDIATSKILDHIRFETGENNFILFNSLGNCTYLNTNFST